MILPGFRRAPSLTIPSVRWQRFRAATQVALIRFDRQARRRWRPLAYTDADPFKIIHIDSGLLTRQQRYVPCEARVRPAKWNGFHEWRCSGYVLDGSWHEDTYPLEDRPIYRALKARFTDDVPWPDIEFIQEVLAGQQHWHSCRSEQDVIERAKRIDALYQTILRDGYKAAAEFRSRLRDWRKVVDDITVNIGPNGEFIRNSSGMHRLVIAQVLRLERTPVRVLIRHRMWQAVRDDVLRTNVVPIAYAEHPDLQDLVGRGLSVPPYGSDVGRR